MIWSTLTSPGTNTHRPEKIYLSLGSSDTTGAAQLEGSCGAFCGNRLKEVTYAGYYNNGGNYILRIVYGFEIVG